MSGKEEIICMTADQWREYEIQSARAEARERQMRWSRKHEAERERRMYFIKQKILGIVIAVAAMIPSLIYKDLVSLILFLPVMAAGIVMAAVNKMFIVNEYYFANGGLNQWKIEEAE